MKSNGTRAMFVLMLVGTGLLVSGCTSLEKLVPLVTEELAMAPNAQEADLAKLNRGRDIYLNSCARCHRMVGVEKYSAQKWEEILPRMSELSQLNADQVDDLTEYILFVVQ